MVVSDCASKRRSPRSRRLGPVDVWSQSDHPRHDHERMDHDKWQQVRHQLGGCFTWPRGFSRLQSRGRADRHIGSINAAGQYGRSLRRPSPHPCFTKPWAGRCAQQRHRQRPRARYIDTTGRRRAEEVLARCARFRSTGSEAQEIPGVRLLVDEMPVVTGSNCRSPAPDCLSWRRSLPRPGQRSVTIAGHEPRSARAMSGGAGKQAAEEWGAVTPGCADRLLRTRPERPPNFDVGSASVCSTARTVCAKAAPPSGAVQHKPARSAPIHDAQRAAIAATRSPRHSASPARPQAGGARLRRPAAGRRDARCAQMRLDRKSPPCVLTMAG